MSTEQMKAIERNFEEDLDIDDDGFLDVNELIKWVVPEGFEGVSYIYVQYAIFYLSAMILN